MIAIRSRSHKIMIPLLLATAVLSACASVPAQSAASDARPAVPRFTPLRPVVVIPGFGNSKLWDPVEEAWVWGTARNMVHTEYEDDLDLPFDPASGRFGVDHLVPRGGFVGSRGPINIAWRISRGLAKRGAYHPARDGRSSESAGEIHPFGYDFRLSATDNARKLDEFIEGIRARHGDPGLEVDVIAFSAGGMIALTYAKLGTADLDRPETWDAGARAAASKIATLILVASPQEGTGESIRVLVRGEKLVRRAWPPEMMATFPSITEMLPAESHPFVDEEGREIDFDVWDAAAWRELRFGIHAEGTQEAVALRGGDWRDLDRGFRASLERAARLRAALRERPVPDGIGLTALAGGCIPTAERVLLRADRTLAFYPSELREDEAPLEELLFGPGDGSISLKSAIARSGRSELFCRGHQGIASDRDAHDAMLRVLAEGSAAAFEAGANALPLGMESAGTR
jgi:hypothetical protein